MLPHQISQTKGDKSDLIGSVEEHPAPDARAAEDRLHRDALGRLDLTLTPDDQRTEGVAARLPVLDAQMLSDRHHLRVDGVSRSGNPGRHGEKRNATCLWNVRDPDGSLKQMSSKSARTHRSFTCWNELTRDRNQSRNPTSVTRRFPATLPVQMPEERGEVAVLEGRMGLDGPFGETREEARRQDGHEKSTVDFETLICHNKTQNMYYNKLMQPISCSNIA